MSKLSLSLAFTYCKQLWVEFIDRIILNSNVKFIRINILSAEAH